MNKYSIKNIFEKEFSFPVWKIEVDCPTDCLVVECRDPKTTLPHFNILGFDGESKCSPIIAAEKEWTLEALQGEFLILKRFGSSSPIEAGIQIIHYPTGQIICHYMEYVLFDVYQGIVLARHRSIPGGLTFAIEMYSGQVNPHQNIDLQYPLSDIKYPLTYTGHKPPFIDDIPYVENIWLLPIDDRFIWSYHLSSDNKYNLHLLLTTRTEALDHKIILEDLDRLIPQPFFQVKRHIFFLSNTKLKIKAYLV
jgi:hypothetical protein